MGRAKKEIDEKEIDEIIDLFMETKAFGNVNELNNNAVFKFSIEIANNDKYIRKNGQKFNSYSKNIWFGSYNGKPYIGKAKIEERKNINLAITLPTQHDPEFSEIGKLVDELHKTPNRLTVELIKIIKGYRKKLSTMLNLQAENKKLKDEIRIIKESYLNLFFLSYSSANSLINMMDLNKEGDTVCYEEFKNIFANDENKIRENFKNKFPSELPNNVMPFNKKHKSDTDKL